MATPISEVKAAAQAPALASLRLLCPVHVMLGPPGFRGTVVSLLVV